MLKFTADHEWIRLDGDVATVGITAHARDQLGDVVYVGLPELGATVAQGDAISVVESVKAASDVYAPLSGEIVAVNEALNGAPEQVSADPQGEGWFFKIRLSDLAQFEALLDEAAYQASLG